MVRSAFAAPPSVTYLFPAGAQRGTTVEIVAGGTFERWPVHGRASSSGISLKAAKEKGKLTVTVAADVELGRHWIWLYDDQGASIAQPFIVGTLPEVREQEPNDEIKTAQKLPFAAVTVNGRFDKPGDADCYAVSLQKGQTLVASFEGWAMLRSPMDAIMQIVSPDGFVLEQNNDFHGLDPFIAFSVPKDGQYVVRTFCFPAVPDTSIRFAGGESYVYRLTMTTGAFADYAFPLAVARDNPGSVALVGWNLPDDGKSAPVRINSSDVATIQHRAIANPIAVRVESHSCIVKPDNRVEPFPLQPPITVTSRLARPRAVDQYLLKAKKGQTLLLRAESQEIGLSVSPVIRVTDISGKELGRAEPAGLHSDTELSFTPPADGEFQLTVRDLYAGGGPRFVYRLRVAAPTPDFALSVAADRFAVVAGQPLFVPITLQRSHGFAGEIDLSFEDLPSGVKASVDPRNDPGKIFVKFTAQADAAVGPFRIFGRAKANASGSRMATASLPAPFDGAPAVRMEYLWLTITRPAAPPDAAKP